MKANKRLLLKHTLISGTTVLILTDYYKKLPYYSDRFYKLINERANKFEDVTPIENVMDTEEEQNKTFTISNTGTAFYGHIKWLIYKNLLINDDNNQQYILIANRLYDHNSLIELYKRTSDEVVNLYNNFIFIK